MRSLAVIWRAAGLLFATHVDAVVEALPPLAWRATPGVPDWVRGVFSYRGQLIPLVDVSLLLGATPSPDRMVNRVLIVRCARADKTGEWPVGLWVDCVLELERIDFDASGSHPGFDTGAGRFLGPIAQTAMGQVQLVKPAEIFTPEQAAILTERLREAAA